MNRYNDKSKEDLNEVSKIYVVSIIDFLDNYKIDLKQKMKLIKNHLNTFFIKKIKQGFSEPTLRFSESKPSL